MFLAVIWVRLCRYGTVTGHREAAIMEPGRKTEGKSA